jgi:heme/copper-type cytochrome/quinol oxidase subunit 3
MEIPYTTEVRPDTGLTEPEARIWLFLASEVMLFGSLFSSYALLRSGAPTWPVQHEVLSVPLAALNTVVLIASSVTMVMAWASLAPHTAAVRAGDREAEARSLKRYRLFMGLTLLGGAIFLVVKSIEYSEKFSHHLYPATNNFPRPVFHADGPARAARYRGDDRQRFPVGSRRADVAQPA